MRRVKHFFHLYRRELFVSVTAITALILFIPIFTYSYFANDLKTKDTIMNKNDTGLMLLDRNDKPFFSFYQAKHKTFIPLSQIPKTTQHAIIASEDKNFYKHSGFSLPAIIRAFFLNIQHNEIMYGGSTITQQLVKNALLNPQKNYMRKIQEIILSQEIERRYSKDEILEMYLNSVYFGEGAFGIENAAQNYFDKHARDLTLAESAFLTGILPSPSMLSPFTGDYQKAKKNQELVLGNMYEQHYITKQEFDAATKEKIVFKPANSDLNSIAPHFALMVRDELIKKYGEEQVARSGFKVRTTIDLTWQKKAEITVAEQVEKLKGNNVSNGAAVVMDPKTGDIKTLVGSNNWDNDKAGKINMATALRSVGSSFKPIIYAAALEQRLITPATILRDAPITYPEGYKPQNYDRKFRGLVTTRRALANSLNVPAVEVMKKVGIENGLNMAKQLGINSLKDPTYYGQGLSVVLGAGEITLVEITNAYATFANSGLRAEPRAILEITDKTQKKIYTAKVQTKKSLTAEAAFLISSILSDNKARQEVFSNLLTISRPAAVKTGTAENYRDSLTLGYTPSIAIGVWVGNSDNTPMDNVAGSLGAAPIWKTLMEEFTKGTAVETFTPPPGIVILPPCGSKITTNISNILQVYAQEKHASNSAEYLAQFAGSASSAAGAEYFMAGTEPTSNVAGAKESCYGPRPSPTAQPSAPTPAGQDYLPTTNSREQQIEEVRQRLQERLKEREERRKERRERFNH